VKHFVVVVSCSGSAWVRRTSGFCRWISSVTWWHSSPSSSASLSSPSYFTSSDKTSP